MQFELSALDRYLVGSCQAIVVLRRDGGNRTRDGELAYSYDDKGNRTGIRYPGGVMATYGYDSIAIGDRLDRSIGLIWTLCEV